MNRLLRPHPPSLRFALIGLLALAAALALGESLQPDPGLSRDALAAVRAAWERVREIGAYRFTADIEQTLIPRALPSLIGQQERRVDLRAEGEVQLPDRARLDIRPEGLGSQAPPVTLIREGEQTFIQKGDELVPAGDAGGLALPVPDYLDFLAAIENVREVERRTVGSTLLTRFAFDLNGPRYALHVRDRMQEALAGELPPGVELQPPPIFAQMKGRGELWVDESGLPVRQVLDLYLPEASDQYHASIRMVVDFPGLGAAEALPATTSIERQSETASAGRPSSSETGSSSLRVDLAKAGARLQAALAQALPMTLIVLFVAGCAAALVAARQRRRMYVIVALSTCMVMIVEPLLQAAQIEQFSVRRAQAASPGIAETAGAPTEADINQAVEAAQRALSRPAAAPAIEGAATLIMKCGDGQPGNDTDDDGLNDLVESCLGTDPYSPDTDHDAITDTLEIRGLTLGARLLTSDPSNPDSNGDGLLDYAEWPAPYGEGPRVDANPDLTWDLDGDGVPGLWDGDNDGDGVSDAIDLSPHTYTPYADQFTVHTEAPGYTGTQYVELQVRPENPAHLRYSLTPLDWPYDTVGQMTDLDDRPGDLRLVPMLFVTSTVAPSLAPNYGIQVQRDPNSNVYSLFVPLSPVDEGGHIGAFYTRLPLTGAAEVADVRLTAEMVWVVQGDFDTHRQDEFGNLRITTQTIALHVYRERFRVTGLNVAKSSDFRAALFGTPHTPNEDKHLFQAALGVSAAYLDYMSLPGVSNDPLANLVDRFRFGATLTETFGVSPTVAVNQRTVATRYFTATHRDEGLARLTITETKSLLNDNYLNTAAAADNRCENQDGETFKCASVLSAWQEDVGVYSLDQAGAGLVDGTLDVNVAEVLTFRERGIKLSLFRYDDIARAWRSLELPDALAIARQRYSAGQLDADLQALRADFPHLEADDLRFAAALAYLSLGAGRISTVAINGVPLKPPTPPEPELAESIFRVGEFAGARLPEYFLRISRLADVLEQSRSERQALQNFEALPFAEDVSTFQRYLRAESTAALGLGITQRSLSAAQVILLAAALACESSEACEGAVALQVAHQIVDSALDVAAPLTAITSLVEGAETAKMFTDLALLPLGFIKALSKMSNAAGAVSLVLDLGFVWLEFGLIYSSASGLLQDEIRAFALTKAIVTSVILIALFVLSFVPVVGQILAILVALFVLVDWIVDEATDGEVQISETVLTFITQLYYNFQLLATIETADFSGQPAGFVLDDEAAGFLIGNRIRMSDAFTGTLKKSTQSDVLGPSDSVKADGLNDSWVQGRLSGSSNLFAVSNVPDSAAGAGDRQCITSGDTRTCMNTTTVEMALSQAKRDVELTIGRYYDYQLMVWERISVPQYGIWIESTEAKNDTQPATDLDPIVIFLDVLPATLDDVWAWTEIVNADADADDLLNAQERPANECANPAAQKCTRLDQWDTDGDGLSDGFERDHAGMLGTDPSRADADGDGLSDRLEISIGTKANGADSDDDGLKDGEEVCHPAGPSGALAGGWLAQIGSEQFRVCSNPLAADDDGDFLNDATERALKSSPYAANDGPALQLRAAPLAVSPDGGRSGVFALPGDPITVTMHLFSTGRWPVTRTLDICLPSLMTNITGGTLTGITTPPAAQGPTSCGPAPSGAGYAWNFGAQNLVQGATVSTTFTTTAQAAASRVGVVEADVIYGGKNLTGTVTVGVDLDNPSVAFTAPTNGALLRGDYFVLGGAAADPTSWVTDVELTLPGETAVITRTLNPWAHTWQLPADGEYTLFARARDQVGHISQNASVRVLVDNTRPAATLDLADGSFITNPVVDGQGNGAVVVTGAASDNLTGLSRVEVSVDGRPWQLVLDVSPSLDGSTPVLNAAWSHALQLSLADASAQGAHSVSVRAWDRAGNVGDVVTRTIVVDLIPPADALTTNAFERVLAVRSGDSLALRGYADDAGNAPPAPRPSELQGELNSLTNATIWLEPASVADGRRVTATWLGDVNGDGRADLAVGMPESAGGAGRVAVVYGRAGGWPTPPDGEALAHAKTSFVGVDSSAHLGERVVAAGDVDADGLNDILVGDPQHNRAFLVFGSAAPMGSNQLLSGASTGDWVVLTSSAAMPVGRWLGAAGDVNGDGFDDLLVGAVNSSDSTQAEAYLILGRAQPWPAELSPADVAAGIAPLPAGGGAATGVGDVDGVLHLGRSADEFVVAYPGDGLYLFPGRLDLTPGARLRFDKNGAVRLPGSSDVGDQVAALGDVNRDDKADFIFIGGGAAHLALGREGSQWNISQTFAGASFVAAPGDVDANGDDDILLGKTNGDADLIRGGDFTKIATLTGVQGAASAPYAAGADLNCDTSSDLLVIPGTQTLNNLEAAELRFGELPYLPEAALPVASPESDSRFGAAALLVESAEVQAAVTQRYVDDDPNCNGQSPCYADIQAAVDAAGVGDAIHVGPGVYAGFTISGTNNLTVRGVNPDAVFVEGGGAPVAVTIRSAVGATLSGLTVRNATDLVRLENAGRGGYITPTLQTRLEQLVMYGFTHAVSMDRVSTLTLRQSTLAGAGAAPYIQVDEMPDPELSPRWTTLQNIPQGVGPGGGMVAFTYTTNITFNEIWARIGGGNKEWFLNRGAGWSPTAVSAPIGFGLGSAATNLGSDQYIMTDPHWKGFPGLSFESARHIAVVGDEVFVATADPHQEEGLVNVYRWNGNSWALIGRMGTLTADRESPVVAGIVVYGQHLIVAGNFSRIVLPDGTELRSISSLARWNRTTASWEQMPGAGDLSAIAASGGNLYVGSQDGRVQRWNGNGWVAIGKVGQPEANGGLSCEGCIQAMAASGSDVYVAGAFTRVEGLGGNSDADATGITRLRGNAWSALGSGLSLSNVVRTIAIRGSEVFVGGSLNEAGGVSVNNIAWWNGAAWSRVGPNDPTNNGVNDTVNAIAVGLDGVYVAGAFTQTGRGGGANLSRIAKVVQNFDGTWTWSGLDTGLNNTVYGMVIEGARLFAAGDFTAPNFSYARVVQWAPELVWFPRQFLGFFGARLFDQIPGDGAAIASDGANALYAFAGRGMPNFYRYDIASDRWHGTWTGLQPLPDPVSSGGALAWVPTLGRLYAVPGGGLKSLYYFTPSNNTWTKVVNDAPYPISTGGALAWDGGEWIYAFPGGQNGDLFLRFNVNTGVWENLVTSADDPDRLPGGTFAGQSASLVRLGDALYANPGAGSNQFWRYGPLGVAAQKLTVESVVFVAPEGASAAWHSLGSLPPDFLINSSNNIWVGGWASSPATDTPISASDAKFLNPAHDVYRLQSGLAIPAGVGYHTFHPDVHVYPSQADCDRCGPGGDLVWGDTAVSSLQAAIDKGALRVLVHMGQYSERFYLVNGVSVFGAGAEKTIVGGPAGAAPLASAEGVADAQLGKLTLARGSGDQTTVGLRIEDGARNVTLTRSIVRGMEVGVRVSGPATQAILLVNNTLVGNGDGLAAESCQSVDVRNTIFAAHTRAAIRYAACPENETRTHHTYNAYWDNVEDLNIGGAPSAASGAGEIFADPEFTAPDASPPDYRPRLTSPVINAGDPADPPLPGTGERVDIGYVEVGRAAFYADDDYCETCPNDGLTWQLDAFDRIQDAVDAALAELRAVGCGGETFGGAPCGVRYTVGVGAGAYPENVTLYSHVDLVGSGAHKTTINGGGGAAVSIPSATQVKVTGFRITGSSVGLWVTGASNDVVLARNLLTGNENGIVFDASSTGFALNNTLVGNTGAGVSGVGARTWVRARNNLVANNGVGLRTADGGQIFNDFNLLNGNTSHYADEAGTGLARGPHDLVDVDPQFDPAAGDYRLSAASPAVDAADPAFDAPVGGGERADIGYRELLAVPLTLFLGAPRDSCGVANSGVERVEVGVVFVADPAAPVTATLPTEWQAANLRTPGQSASYWSLDLAPTQGEGLYRLYTRAADRTGNQSSDPLAQFRGAFVVDGTAPVVSWLAPTGETTSPLELRAQASDDSAAGFSVAEIFFEVDGQVFAAEWAPEPAQGAARAFRAWVDLAPGAHDVIAIARDRAGNEGRATVTVNIAEGGIPDTTPPTLNATAPADGQVSASTLTFEGTASDEGGSGLLTVEVSLDGGVTWTPASVNAGQWSLAWAVPQDQDHVSYLAQIRARDKAGNAATQQRIVVVDNRPPDGVAPITLALSAEPEAFEGQHLHQAQTLTLNWSPPRDGGGAGAVTVLVAVDQITDTVPTQAASGNSFSAELNANGDWYAHLSVVDGVGNRSDHHFGPWHMGADFRSVRSGAVNPNQVAAAAPWAQSIIVDGILDRANNEWRPDVEFLDDDERSSRRQSLYASWDQQNFYLGWYGAAWILDGTMFAYFDTASGGARQAIGTGLPALPFDADYAVEVTGLTTGPSASPNAVAVWRYTSGRWQKQSGLPAGFEVVHAGTYFTEMRLPFGSAQVSGDLRVIAFAVDEAGRAWSVFPTTNPLSGPWADAYVWSNPTRSDSDAAPNGGQITSQSAALTLHSPQDALSALGPDDALTYVLEVTNLEAEALPATRLTLAATAGLGYRQLEGDGACVACPTDGAEWVIDLAPIAPQASAHITLTGQLAPALSLTSIEVVTTTARLEWPAPTGTVALAEAALTHVVDNQPPQVEIVTRLGQTLRAGIQDIAGQATDGDGSGVDYVEVRLADAAWQRADGTVVWTKTIDLTGAADGALVRLEARAVDRQGYVSEVAQAEFVVDAQSPVISLDLPDAVAGPFVVFGGTAADPSPTGSRVVKVEVQFDEEGSLWIEASSPVPPGSDWNYTWEPPFNPQNGTPHRVRARAYDEAGNVSDPTAWAATTVFQPWPVDAGFDQTTTEGVPAAFAGSFSEWGSDGPYTLEWDFGDGQTTAGTLTPAHTYFTSDTYTVTLSVAHDGLTVRDSLAMIVLEDQTPPVTTASVTGPTRSGCSSSRYFGQARVTLATNESATTRYRVISFTGSSTPWQTYVGPFNISGEGRNTLQVYSVDLLGNQEAIRHIPVRVTTFPATRVLDSFNRSDGGLGSTWGGSIKLTNYQIISRTVDVNTGGTLYWMEGQPYGADQEAFFKLRVVDMDASEQALLLKVQGGAHPRWQNGAIEVLYDARVGAVRVRTFRPGQLRWKKYADIPIRFYNGDRLGGRVLANGQVWLYRNCLLFARLTLDPADQSFFNARGGRIGVRFTNAADALLDNFGGGTR